MERIIKLNNNNLMIKCNIKEYDEIINNRIMMFDDGNESNNKIIIDSNKTIVTLNKNTITLNEKILHTDLYQLINNIISNLINDDNNLYIHSCIITKNNKTFMILGDFNSGKTTLSLEAEKQGYKILSADQSWLRFDDCLKLYKGSLYLSYNDGYKILDYNNKDYKIDSIYVLQNINDGQVNVFKPKDDYRKIKTITKYCTWSTNNILMTDDIELFLDKKAINNFVKKINISLKYIYGNVKEIIKEMEKEND